MEEEDWYGFYQSLIEITYGGYHEPVVRLYEQMSSDGYIDMIKNSLPEDAAGRFYDKYKK